MKKYHIFHLDTNEDTPGNVLQPWMGEYNFSDWKKPPMNYIIINKTKKPYLILEITQNIQVLVKSRTLVRNCKHNTFRIDFRHNMQIHNPQDRLHYTSSKKNIFIFYFIWYISVKEKYLKLDV